MNKLIALICLLPLAAFGQGFGYVGVVANRTNGELLTPTNFINSFVGGSNVVIVPTNNGVGWKLIINAASGGGGGGSGVDGSANSNLSYSIGAAATNFTLAASNAVRLVSGLDATNHGNAQLQSATNYANSVTNSSIVRQLDLTAASNAVVSYANGVTNSSIVRQTQLTTASNTLVAYANSTTNSSIVRQADLTAASNALAAIVGETNWIGDASVTNATRIGLAHSKSDNTNRVRTLMAGTGIVLTNEGTNIMFAVDPATVASQANLTAASNSLVTYANGVTNASIVRQTELTAASNALVTFAISTTNSSIVRQLELTAASNAVLATTYTVGANLTNYVLTASNGVRIVAGLDATNHANAILQSATNYANGVTNSTLARQADLTALSNNLLSVTYTVGANATTHVNNATVALTNALLGKVDELSGVSTGQTFYGGIVASNLAYSFSTTDNVATNGSANSNLVVDVDVSTRDLYLTNSISLTNWSNLAAGTSKNFIRFLSPILINRTVVYPTLGGSSFGIRTFTNANSPMWTTLTQGVTYALSGTTRGTNVHLSISEWK